MKHIFLFIILAFSLSLSAQETSYICGSGTKTLTFNPDAGVTCPSGFVVTWTSPSNVTTTGVSVTANAAGVWTYSASCPDYPSCPAATGTHTIVIEPDPTASITLNATNSCVGANQTISATGVPSGYTYAWDFGSGANPATSTSSSASVSYSTTGTKTITLVISKTFTGSTNGCSATCTWTKTTTITIGNLTGSSSCS